MMKKLLAVVALLSCGAAQGVVGKQMQERAAAAQAQSNTGNGTATEGDAGKRAEGRGASGPGTSPEVAGGQMQERAAAKQALRNTFNGIYAEGTWGKNAEGRGTSGSGSSLEVTAEYRAFLEEFIKKNGIASVVDAGCGDWSFSSAIDWNGAEYLGLDISSAVVAAAKAKYEKGRVRFEVEDATEDLPRADLLICKDVLQHLSNELIAKFVRNNLKKGKYKWALLVNDRQSHNRDIPTGGHRGIDLSRPPFGVQGLVDLPIKFGRETPKIAQLLDLRGE